MFNGSLLRALRKQHLLRRRDVADAIGVTQPAIGAFERGDRTPRPALVDALSDLFHVDRADFFIPDDSCPAAAAFTPPTTQGDILRAVATLAAVGRMQQQPTTAGVALRFELSGVDKGLQAAVAGVAGISAFMDSTDTDVSLSDLLAGYLAITLPALDAAPLACGSGYHFEAKEDADGKHRRDR